MSVNDLNTASIDKAPRDRTTARLWGSIAVASSAQLIIALDATVMNIALPSAQAGLGFSDAERPWVISAYGLAFGGFLLLGGRLSDRIGRKRAFLIGLVGFSAASAFAGVAANLAMLAAARAGQGLFAALLAPTALGLVSVTFSDPRRRAGAFGIFGAIAGSGGAIGLLSGGLVTQELGWRWCCYLDVVVAAVVFVCGSYLLPHATPTARSRLDGVGAVLITGGIAAAVYGFSSGAKGNWISTPVLVPLFVAGTALAAFCLYETRLDHPLLPLRLLRHRSRLGSCLAAACAVAALEAMFLLLTFYLQSVQGYRPVAAGVAFLPLSLAVLVSSQLVAGPLSGRVAARTSIVFGLLASALAMALLTHLNMASKYQTDVLPAMVLLGFGAGCILTPAITVATAGADRNNIGVTAAIVSTSQQLGGALGIAILNTVATRTSRGFRLTHPQHSHVEALVHGYTSAAGTAGVLLAIAAVVVAVVLERRPG